MTIMVLSISIRVAFTEIRHLWSPILFLVIIVYTTVLIARKPLAAGKNEREIVPHHSSAMYTLFLFVLVGGAVAIWLKAILSIYALFHFFVELGL